MLSYFILLISNVRHFFWKKIAVAQLQLLNLQQVSACSLAAQLKFQANKTIISLVISFNVFNSNKGLNFFIGFAMSPIFQAFY